MAQPFYARKTVLKIGPRKGETVYSAQPYFYGTLTTKDIAIQIAQESSLTPADVIGVIDRLAYYCQSHCSLGYKVRIDGLGVIFNDFITEKTVSSADEVTAKLVKCIRPAFTPEYTIVNGSFRYALLPERIDLVKIKFKETEESVPDEEDQPTTEGEESTVEE